jgi:site-specific DNA-methyltransferase (adenine-specific)
MKAETLFSSKRMDWCTPKAFFAQVDHVYRFTLDAACTAGNKLCVEGLCYPEADGLISSWAESRVWCNPPYGRTIMQWIEKAIAEAANCPVIVMLIPARTDTKWWHKAIESGARPYFIRGRLKFDDMPQAAPFPSALLIWENLP